MAELRQVGLKLSPELITRLDVYAREKGLNRTSAIINAINQMIDGNSLVAPVPPSASSGTSTVDLQARGGLAAPSRAC